MMLVESLGQAPPQQSTTNTLWNATARLFSRLQCDALSQDSTMFKNKPKMLELSLDSIVPIGSTLSNEELNQLVLLHEDSTVSDKANGVECFGRKFQIHPPRKHRIRRNIHAWCDS
ncbi:hypothetical protein KIN20_022730 [Parelaphostrongylus tenuis]|uniref:Uncharacterized protein n=1 Tax=Parelaphostrongylus tenuis TaxID=148309 RepID=A0AAD5MVW7_PARTN|nr:hypothetical protein KIN20_022730 [Parelaphostrongylus tenuis]